MIEPQTTKVICGYWDGKCKAIAISTIPDIGETVAEWLADGADIKTYPLEEAKREFERGMSW